MRGYVLLAAVLLLPHQEGEMVIQLPEINEMHRKELNLYSQA